VGSVAQADDSVQQFAAAHDAHAFVPYGKPQALVPASAAELTPASAGALKYWSIPIACRQAATNMAAIAGASIHRAAAEMLMANE
jgi:hypothetical protein